LGKEADVKKYLFFLATLACAQTAKYPGAIATDADLFKAKDRSASTLTSNIDAATLSIPVADGTRFVANEVITIDSEQMVVCSVAGNTLTICTGTRGFDWTDPAPHSVGAAVRGQVTAWHHNAMSEEVKAVENALGVNLGNVALAGHMQALNKGGTNQTSWTAARCVRVSNNGLQLESAPADCGSGGGGSGDITAVGDCPTGDCYQAVTANYIYAGPASGGAAPAAMRALVDADIPDNITLTDITQITNRSHTSLSDIGSNTHAQIDATLGATKTSGSVLFAGTGGAYSQDNAMFFWDNTNKRLGIGTAAPSAMLSVGNSNQFTVTSVGNVTANSFNSPNYMQANSVATNLLAAAATIGNLTIRASGTGNILFTGWTGNIGIGTTSPTISGTGRLHVSGNTARPFDATRTPASSSEACNAGEVVFDASYVYVCVATNTWKRADLATW
jgi:hypothetical protein